jgi:uncharacterized protein (TIGR01777 family)
MEGSMSKPVVKRKGRLKALPHVVIAGGAGTLGQALAADLTYLGYQVSILTRSRRPDLVGDQVLWDGRTVDPSWGPLLKDAVLFNLAGELVDRPNSPENTALLQASRVEPTLALVEASTVYGRPLLWAQMSTLAIYGDAGDTFLTEDSPVADGPAQMAGVARAWEAAAAGAKTRRMVTLRTGVVLGNGMPALDRLVTMTRWFLGGQVAEGRQYISWIHVADFLKAMRFLLLDPSGQRISGVVHVTSARPVRNRHLMRVLRQRLHRPWTPATPAHVVELGARWLFRTDPALALTGRKGYPDVLVRAGFEFTFPTIDKAFDDLLPTSSPWSHKVHGWRLKVRRWTYNTKTVMRATVRKARSRFDSFRK